MSERVCEYGCMCLLYIINIVLYVRCSTFLEINSFKYFYTFAQNVHKIVTTFITDRKNGKQSKL